MYCQDTTTDTKTPYTLRRLLLELNKLPEVLLDKVIWTEGCDCVGDIGSIIIDKNGEVQLLRSTR